MQCHEWIRHHKITTFLHIFSNQILVCGWKQKRTALVQSQWNKIKCKKLNTKPSKNTNNKNLNQKCDACMNNSRRNCVLIMIFFPVMSHQRDCFSHVTRQFPHHLSWVMKWPAAAWHLAPSLSSASAWSTSRKPCVPTDPPIVCAYVVCHARRGGPAHFDPVS